MNYNYESVSQKEQKDRVPGSYGYGIRHVQVMLLFASLCVFYMISAHLAATIVAMTYATPLNSIQNDVHMDLANDNVGYESLLCNVSDTNDDFETRKMDKLAVYSLKPSDRNLTWSLLDTFPWPKSVQETILAASVIGSTIMVFPMGVLAQRHGGKLPLQVAFLVNGIVSIITPWSAAWGGWRAVVGCQFIQGLTLASVYPSTTTLLSKWIPLSERSRLGSYVYTGTTIGTIVAYQLSGLLASSRWGWPSVFWTIGVISIITFTLITIFGASNPLEHKSISEEEKIFIMRDLNNKTTKKFGTPWKSILTSKHVWAIFAAHVGAATSYWFCMVQMPTYINQVLKINARNSALLSSLPFVAKFFTCIGFGMLSDFCTNRKIISVKNARKIANSIAAVGVAVCLSAFTFTMDINLAMFLFVTSMGMYSAIYSGLMINYIDISPHFSGILMGLGNLMTSVAYLPVPVLISYFVVDMSNQYQWRVIFMIMSSLSFGCNIIFVVCMSAEVQLWNHSAAESASNTIELKLN